jgi:hypothetical protein
MRNTLFIVLVLTLFACDRPSEKYYYSEPIKLRQLVTDTTTEKYSSGSFFLVGGSYSSHEETMSTIKVFGRIGGYYKFIEMDMTEIRIKINDSLTEPNIVVRYYNNRELSMEKLTSSYCYERNMFIINCPEKYLPKKLLPIEL